MNQSIESLAQTFNAPSAWLVLFNPQKRIDLVSSYKLPSLFQQDQTILNDEARACLKVHQQDGLNRVQIIAASILLKANQYNTNRLHTT